VLIERSLDNKELFPLLVLSSLFLFSSPEIITGDY